MTKSQPYIGNIALLLATIVDRVIL